MDPDQVAQVRRFNRLVIQRAGGLYEHFLGRARPLGASRVLYAIGYESSQDGADLRDLRARLGLDSGYLTRLVQSLEKEGLVKVRPDPGDERVRTAVLTRAGKAEVAEIDRRSDESASSILEPLTPAQRERLVAAMAEVHRLLRVAGARIERVDPSTRPARWCVEQYFAELARRFEEGFDPARSIPADDDELRPPNGSFLLASTDGEPVACGAVKVIEPGIGSIKRMWVSESVRGLGFGRRMLAALEQEAQSLGLGVVRLETHRSLEEAIDLYRSSGYREVARFNDDPYAGHWFEKRLC